MDQAIADFAIHLRDRNRSPITIARYSDLLRRFARFACAELHQETISPGQIDKALVVLFVREGGVAGTQALAATRNSRLAAIRAFFRFLLAEARVTRDPTASIHSAALPARAPTFLTTEEFTRIRRAVEEHASEFYLRRDLAILVTLWNSGLRLAELLSLDLAVVDFEGEVFRAVRRKGGKVLPVYFNVDVTIALRRWLWQRKEYPNAAAEPALFLSDRGRRLSPRAAEDLVAKYARLAGIDKHVTPHVLRHSTATALIRAGNGIEVVADVLAHSSLDTTRHYVHLVGEQVHAAVASLTQLPRCRAVR
ncbi:MAG: tyrosine-type recombinase/integrase [Phycisphaerae bacterium]|nr:tyrosine-type recombinase/integrase [Phycisphaerae bacterium]